MLLQIFPTTNQLQNIPIRLSIYFANHPLQSLLIGLCFLEILQQVPLHLRNKNIINILCDVSGEDELILTSPQYNKPLLWIIYQDKKHLSYNLSNLVLPYDPLMIITWCSLSDDLYVETMMEWAMDMFVWLLIV